ncbi:MAG TPA: acetate kinase, partial [Gaiellaceae bacterium]|nr:acetate kinase [Gaiellaceae bacterium]
MPDATVLVVNAGSTSLKLHLVSPADDAEALASFRDVAPDRVAAVAHRVVHGGELREPARLTEDVLAAIEEASTLAPLHNRPALAAVDEAVAALPAVPHVAVFDTGFHATIPPAAATYAVPRRWREEWGVRRYGFHGLSVQWAAERARARRLVVCHLGGGSSITAVLDGRSVDTTMGFSPLEGVPMTTRAGSVDPGALLHLLREGLLELPDLERELEHESGLAGLSEGGSGDIREASPLALDVYVHRVAGAVGAAATALGGLDALVFTAGIGER